MTVQATARFLVAVGCALLVWAAVLLQSPEPSRRAALTRTVEVRVPPAPTTTVPTTTPPPAPVVIGAAVTREPPVIVETPTTTSTIPCLIMLGSSCLIAP